jgi:hypothetical protein
MWIAKAQLIKLVENLPETVEIEEVLYRLALREKLGTTEEDVRAGRVLSEDEVTAEIASDAEVLRRFDEARARIRERTAGSSEEEIATDVAAARAEVPD